VSGDRHDLRNRASRFSQRLRGVLSESMHAVAAYADGTQVATDHRGKTLSRLIWLATLPGEDVFATARQRRQDRPQPMVTWDGDVFARFLLLRDFDDLAIEL